VKIKLSGIVILIGAACVILICGMYIFRSFFPAPATKGYDIVATLDMTDPKNISVPEHLAKTTANYHLVYKDFLTKEWSRSTKAEEGFGPTVSTLAENYFAEVRCNGDDKFRFMVDSNGLPYLNYKPVKDFSKWPPCYSVEVRAADPINGRVAYVVGMTK